MVSSLISYPTSTYTNNKGSILAISLVLLTSITLIAIFSIQRSGLQSKIVANIQHVEMLFNTALNDQNYWFSLLQQDESGDEILAAPLSSFIVDENNQRQYQAISLDSLADEVKEVSIDSQIVHTPAKEGQLSLSEGNEVNSRIDYKFELASEAGITTRHMAVRQKTGISFPGLNNQQNSMY